MGPGGQECGAGPTPCSWPCLTSVQPHRYMSLAVCELDRPGLGPLVAAACSDGAVR